MARTHDNDPDRPDDAASPLPDRFTIHRLPAADLVRIAFATATHHERLLTDPAYRAAMDAQDERQRQLWTQRGRERAAAWLQRWGIDP